MLAQHLHGFLAVAIEQVADGESTGEHDADIAGNLDGAEQFLLVGEHRVETPHAEVFHEEASEVLDDGQRQDDLDKRVHQLTEHQKPGHHPRRPIPQAGSQQETEHKQGREQAHAVDKTQAQVMQGRRGGGDDVTHRQVEGRDHHQRRKHRKRDADQPGHGPQRQVLVVLALEHHQADRDQVDNGRAGGVADDHGGDPHVAVRRQGIGQLVAAHVHGNDRQRRNRHVRPHRTKVRPQGDLDEFGQVRDRHHDARLRQEHRADGVDAVDKLLAQAAVRLDHGCKRANHRADHDQVNNVVAKFRHCFRSICTESIIFVGVRPSSVAPLAKRVYSSICGVFTPYY